MLAINFCQNIRPGWKVANKVASLKATSELCESM